jgi:hypothetical protein
MVCFDIVSLTHLPASASRSCSPGAVVRRHTETCYGAKSWGCERRVVARSEATTQGLGIRYLVTSLQGVSAEWLYDIVYCARGKPKI